MPLITFDACEFFTTIWATDELDNKTSASIACWVLTPTDTSMIEPLSEQLATLYHPAVLSVAEYRRCVTSRTPPTVQFFVSAEAYIEAKAFVAPYINSTHTKSPTDAVVRFVLNGMKYSVPNGSVTPIVPVEREGAVVTFAFLRCTIPFVWLLISSSIIGLRLFQISNDCPLRSVAIFSLLYGAVVIVATGWSMTEVALRTISPFCAIGLVYPTTRCLSIGFPGLSVLSIVTKLFSCIWNS